MIRVWLGAALCAVTFGSTITYNYTGNVFTRCNGTTSINGSCPSNSFSDHDVASLTFSTPLAANLSSATESTSPNLIAWTMGDALGLTPSFSSTDVNAAAELAGILLSTNGSGGISAWGMLAETSATTPATTIEIASPAVIGGSGFPLADYLDGSFGNSFPGGWHVSNGAPGVWTETLNGFQGGTPTAPVYLIGGSPVAGLTGSIGGQGTQEYYGFYWNGGAFSATASITGASSTASYLFTEGLASGFCGGGASNTLNSSDSFTSTIANANLAPGQYCIGIDANSANDPNFSLTFNTPVSGVPEPSSFVLFFTALVVLGLLRLRKTQANHS